MLDVLGLAESLLYQETFGHTKGVSKQHIEFVLKERFFTPNLQKELFSLYFLSLQFWIDFVQIITQSPYITVFVVVGRMGELLPTTDGRLVKCAEQLQ